MFIINIFFFRNKVDSEINNFHFKEYLAVKIGWVQFTSLVFDYIFHRNKCRVSILLEVDINNMFNDEFSH